MEARGTPGFLKPFSRDRIEDLSKGKAYSLRVINGREIRVPRADLFEVQREIKLNLEKVYTPRQSVHGYVKGRSVRTALEPHTGKAHVIHVDIKRFFHSIGIKAISDTVRPWFPREHLLIAELCTAVIGQTRACPQGAPTSPIVSNLVFDKVDASIEALCASIGYVYTRYSDNMLFSPMGNRWRSKALIERLESLLAKNGFSINHEKTRVMRCHQRQKALGGTVNTKVSPSKELKEAAKTSKPHLAAARIYDPCFEP